MFVLSDCCSLQVQITWLKATYFASYFAVAYKYKLHDLEC